MNFGLDGDPVESKLSRCIVRTHGNGTGTAFFISEHLAVTCAHNYRGCVRGQKVSVYPAEYPEEGTILDIDEHEDHDYCFILFEKSMTSDYVCLDSRRPLGCELTARGYTLKSIGTPKKETYSGRFEGTEDAPDKVRHPFALLKIQHTQVLPGLSGSPLINLQTGRCVGMTIATRSAERDAGGWGISAELLMNKLQPFAPHILDTLAQAGSWDRAAKQHRALNYVVPGNTSGIFYDIAYSCDRKRPSKRFTDVYYAPARPPDFIEHYLITGRATESPFGFARKLIFEQITTEQRLEVAYPRNPERKENRFETADLEATTNVIEFLKLLFKWLEGAHEAGSDPNVPASFYPVFLKKFRNRVTVLPIAVELNGSRAENLEVLEMIRRFITELDIARAGQSMQVFFFWCFSWSGLSYYNRAALVERTLSGLKDTRMINDNDLGIVPAEDVSEWLRNFSRHGDKARRIGEARSAVIERMRHARDLENVFISLIDEFNEI